MNAHRSAFFACEQCRERKRRCDKAKPKCSSCTYLDVECFYKPASDPRPSQLVQELSSIRERLDYIAPLVENLGNPPTFWKRTEYLHPQPQAPPISIKSQSLMQTIGLRSDFAAFLYQLEKAAPYTPVTSMELSLLRLQEDKVTEIIRVFTERVHVWYPVIHLSITDHLVETNSSCFSPSTKSCLSLLVISIAFILSTAQSESIHFEVALSMLPIVLQEDSVISIQCLVLLSIYFACRMQPRQSYGYIRIASFRVQSLLRSEISMHLNLSAAYSQPRPGRSHSPIPFPTKHKYWNILPELFPSRSWSTPSSDPPSHLQHDSLHFFQELHLQQLIDKCIDSATGASCTAYPTGTSSVEYGISLQRLLDSLPPIPHFSVLSMSQDMATRHQHAALLRAKCHAYEISSYWPAIYRAIVLKCVDSELLSYASLFIESIVNFLDTASFAVRVCAPKSWSLSASLFIVSMVAIWTVDNLHLQSPLPLSLRRYLKDTLDTLKQFSELSPLVKHMAEVLENRLQEIDVP
ncbi:conserved hypothetical protein [Talaromyces stipitatus ATCC 10500]|uniref:Zn(2)-C6 fungal-type domain-containing protein n=1 Tax=Talaromyces stipitatus (strain ATCC 10500 / CBS 375.48 / QM 6759 / NRRL 1006) TaxID=441959 RepID=B8MJN0_TALSN|nr:uncharacterized protein TSTA_051660 [Talaromyces stipitatus ATCC 10500]EED15729.1 conserved hypothetical protein [Talaromyces stipitatus ATCC 10500]